MSKDFTPDQKRFLEGFVSGLEAARAARGTARPGGAAATKPVGPDAIHIEAQDRVTAAGGKLADQEKFKREQHPFDAYERLKQQSDKNEPPKPADNFRWRYYGLFYVAPTQTSYMCRLRIANGILQADGSLRPEPRMDARHAASAVLQMANLPLDVNVQFMTIMASKMPFVGRG